MAKDRISFAKRQREMEQKRKASEKRELRNRRKTQPEQVSELTDASSSLSPEQLEVLSVFRKFRTSPGQMLCFSRVEIESLSTPLAQLADNGLLVAERSHGGYSLTPTGFAAMQAIP